MGLFSFAAEEAEHEGHDGALLGLGDALHDALGLTEEVAERLDLAVEGGGFFAAQAAGLFLAGAEGPQGGVDFAALAFAGDGAEHAPDVFFGLEEFLALALAD